jgi:hypothetical protein
MVIPAAEQFRVLPFRRIPRCAAEAPLTTVSQHASVRSHDVPTNGCNTDYRTIHRRGIWSSDDELAFAFGWLEFVVVAVGRAR